MDDIGLAAATHLPVLITAGEDLARRTAEHIHLGGHRTGGPFVTITAGSDREAEWPHAWARARGGTLFIARAERLSVNEQRWLLARLQADATGGSPRVRVLLSAETSLFERCRAGLFSEALFYRVNLLHLVPTDDGRTALSA